LTLTLKLSPAAEAFGEGLSGSVRGIAALSRFFNKKAGKEKRKVDSKGCFKRPVRKL
jgi:hypothetical protein